MLKIQWSADENRYFSVMTVVFYCACLLLCEFVQCLYGQSLLRGIKDSLLFVSVLILLPMHPQGNTYIFTILVWAILDMISFAWSGDSFSVQFFHGLCIQDILCERARFHFCGLFLLFMIAIMALHPHIFIAHKIVLPKPVQVGLITFIVFLLFGFYSRETAAFHPNAVETRFNSRKFMSLPEKVNHYLTEPFSATFVGKKKKNIIVIDIAKFETQMIGRYSSRWIYGTPFLTKLSHTGLLAQNVYLEPFTPLDGGGLWTALCSMPVNMNPDHIIKLAQKNNLTKVHCLGDFLDTLGYNVATYRAGKSQYGGLEPVLVKHGLRNIVDFPHDQELFVALNETGLPNLVRQQQPFALYVTTIDTKPQIFAQCPYRAELYKGHREYHAVDCIDQYLEGFFAKLAELKLTPENTQIVIFGDGIRDDLNKSPIPLFKDPRRIFALFPFAPKEYVSEAAGLYDITPTLLDLTGIEFSPKFPFGGNVRTAPNGYPNKNIYAQLFKGLE